MGLQQSSCQINGVNVTEKDIAQISALMMPVYYLPDEVTTFEIEVGKRTWNMIMQDTSPVFVKKSAIPTFKHSTCIMYFCELYFQRLFDVHPLCKSMFSMVGLFAQGNFLVKMIGMCLTPLEDNMKLKDTLTKLADAHNTRGVKAIEYGIIGEVLFWSLKQCLGEEIMDEATTSTWMKIFSRLLRVMVPVALAYELANGQAQEERTSTLMMQLNGYAGSGTTSGLYALPLPLPYLLSEVPVTSSKEAGGRTESEKPTENSISSHAVLS